MQAVHSVYVKLILKVNLKNNVHNNRAIKSYTMRIDFNYHIHGIIIVLQ